MKQEQETLITIKDVTKLLNISRTTVYRLLEKGDIPSYKIGNQLRFKLSEIEAYIEASKQS